MSCLAILAICMVVPSSTHRRFTDGDARMFLSLLITVASIAHSIMNSINGGAGDIPEWLLTTNALVVGFYFADRQNDQATLRENKRQSDATREKIHVERPSSVTVEKP